MKKFVIPITIAAIVIVVGYGASQHWEQIKAWFGKAPQLSQIIQNNSTVQELQQRVLTAGPLRGSTNNPNAFLTRVGVINQTNLARQQNGNLPALTENIELDKAAQLKLKDMFAQQYFEHISPEGKGPADLAQAAGYSYVLIGENLALGNFTDDQDLLTAWMNSPGHRANILLPKFKEIGVAVGQGEFEGQKTWLAVQEFGEPASACPAVDATLKSQINQLQGEIDALKPQLTAEKSQIDNNKPQSQSDYDAYNKLVAQYNDQVAIFNNKVDTLKMVTEQYNSQVLAYNACAGN